MFELKDDEALVLEYPEPQAGFWSIQVQNVWTKPINDIDRQRDINGRHAVIAGDGKFRRVIAATAPILALPTGWTPAATGKAPSLGAPITPVQFRPSPWPGW